jgi:hypothetical protein
MEIVPNVREGEILPSKSYAFICRMVERYSGPAAVYIQPDGTADMHKENARPDKPMLVEVEGKEPTDEQITSLALTYAALELNFGFCMVSACPAILPHVRELFE